MRKKTLYITNYKDGTTTVGYRFLNILKYSAAFLDIDVLDIPSKNQFSFFGKILNKLFIYPDIFYFSLYKYKNEIRKRLNEYKYDLVIIEIQPFSFLSLATYIKKLNPEIKVVIDLNDPLTANVSYINDGIVHKRFISWYEKRHFINLDILIVLNEEIKSYYYQKYSFVKDIIILEQGMNPSSYNSGVKVKNHKLEVIYAGMLYSKVREPFSLYEAVGTYDGNIRLSVYGSFKKIFKPPNSERFYCGGFIDKEVLEERTTKADIVVFIDNFWGIQIPGKILEILETEKPILYIYENSESPTLKYIKNQAGIYYAKNDTEEIVKQLTNISTGENHYFKRDLTMYYWENLIKNLFLSNPNLLN